MKEREIVAGISILGASMGIIRLSSQPIPDYIPKWLEWGVTIFLMAQFIASVYFIKKKTRP